MEYAKSLFALCIVLMLHFTVCSCKMRAHIEKSLSSAIQHGDVSAVARYLDSGGVSGYVDDTGETALILAAKHEQLEIADLLLKSGCDVNERNLAGYTPLFSAVFLDHDDMVKLLLRSGADPNKGMLYGDIKESPLFRSITNQSIGVTTLLLMYGADLDVLWDEVRDVDPNITSTCFLVTKHWKILSQLLDKEIVTSPNEKIKRQIAGKWSDLVNEHVFREDGTCLVPENSEHPEVVGTWLYSSSIMTQLLETFRWHYYYMILKVDGEYLELINLETLDIVILKSKGLVR